MKINLAFSKLRKLFVKNLSFSFRFIDKKKIFNQLQKLKSNKACQESDHYSIQIFQENITMITEFIYNNFNNSLVHIFHQI